jgi:ADP-heptose:LPS heptosyltransferase
VAPFRLQISAADEAMVRQLLRDCGIDRYILLSPGGGWRSKCWPPERFGQLAQQIRNSLGLRCVLNYGPGEENLVQTITTASATAEPVAYSGTLEKLMPLVRNALCIVGGDTGPLHLAVALGTPSVSVYGPTDPLRNGPFPNRLGPDVAKNIVLRAPGAVRDHRRVNETDPSILKISVSEVFNAVQQLLGPSA